MNQPCLQGIELRYVLTMYLFNHGPASVTEMVDALGWYGFLCPWQTIEGCVGCIAVGDGTGQSA